MADFAREQERKYKHEIDVLEKKTQTAMEARDSVMAGQYEARLRELQKNTPERRDVS
jgi:hypothetical protein